MITEARKRYCITHRIKINQYRKNRRRNKRIQAGLPYQSRDPVDTSLPGEEWRICAHFPKYEVSNLGRFRNGTTLYVIKKHPNRTTHQPYVKLRGGSPSKLRTIRTAPLVAQTWIGPRPTPDHQVDHVNGIKADETIGNLEWVTQQVNIQRSYDKGQHPRRVGDGYKLTELDYVEIKRLISTGLSQVSVGKIMKITNATVSRIMSGKIRPGKQSLMTPEEYHQYRLDVASFHINRPVGATRLAKLMKIPPVTARRYIRELRLQKLKKDLKETPYASYSPNVAASTDSGESNSYAASVSCVGGDVAGSD